MCDTTVEEPIKRTPLHHGCNDMFRCHTELQVVIHCVTRCVTSSGAARGANTSGLRTSSLRKSRDEADKPPGSLGTNRGDVEIKFAVGFVGMVCITGLDSKLAGCVFLIWWFI